MTITTDHGFSAQGEGNREHLDSAVRRNAGSPRACGFPRMPRQDPVPALLEYLPYRKRDGTHVRDALTHPYFAGHGYAAIRVDMRGNGDSDGLMLDEYAKQEQDDALEVIAWLAKQTWCTGKVGMFGISWGGFNALQVAARKPPALKAIVTICSTDDRYEDDIHYKGGTRPQRDAGLGRHHAGLFLAPARPQDRGQPLAQDVDGAAGERALPRHPLARAPAPRRLLEARLGVRGLRGRRGADPGGGRLERCLFQRRAAPDEGAAQPRARRSSGPGRTSIRISPCPNRASASCRRPCAGGTSG